MTGAAVAARHQYTYVIGVILCTTASAGTLSCAIGAKTFAVCDLWRYFCPMSRMSGRPKLVEAFHAWADLTSLSRPDSDDPAQRDLVKAHWPKLTGNRVRIGVFPAFS